MRDRNFKSWRIVRFVGHRFSALWDRQIKLTQPLFILWFAPRPQIFAGFSVQRRVPRRQLLPHQRAAAPPLGFTGDLGGGGDGIANPPPPGPPRLLTAII